MEFVSVGVKLTPEVKVELDAYCLRTDTTISQVLRRLVKELLAAKSLEVKNG